MTIRGYVLTVLTTVTLAAAASAAEVRGVISKVDLDKNEITLEGRGKGARGMTYSFAVDKDTQVLLGGQSAALKDLTPGKHVHVFYETRGDRTVALTIKGFAFGAPPATTSTPALPNADPNAVTGTLQRVAYTEREIVVVGTDPKGAEKETTLRVPTDVEVMRADKAIPFDDLKEGERVAVTVAKRDGKLTATAIQVGDAPPATTAPKKGSRLERVLEIAGQLMQLAEKMRQNRP